MTKQIYFLTLFALTGYIIFLASCRKDVTNIKLPDSTPKLVVGCFISPQDTLIVVTLTRSNPIFGPSHNNSYNALVADASVNLSDGAASITVLYNSDNEQYELHSNTFPISAGQTYFLNVSTPKGESVSASCTVPPSNPTSLTVDFIDTVSDEKQINVKWQDIPDQTNYYRVFGQMLVIDSLIEDTFYQSMSVDPSLQNDNEKDGEEMSAKMNGNNSYNYINGIQYANKVIAYDIYLLNIDLEYYKYMDSFGNYSYTISGNGNTTTVSSGDPFSEPILLYTNVKGGLGIFAAYQKLHVRVP